MEKSATLIGMIQTTEGYHDYPMNVMPMDDVKEANHVSNKTMGFKFAWGRTAEGHVLEFIKAGNWAKRDFKAMQEMGVIELGSSWAWAPKTFKVPQGLVKILRSFEIGKETSEYMNRWAKAFGIV